MQKPATLQSSKADVGSASVTASAPDFNQDNRVDTKSHQRSPLRASVYAKNRPNQLHRLAKPTSGLATHPEFPQAKAQANLSRPVRTPLERLPHKDDKRSPIQLVHKGRHSLVRRSSGSILSAVARTVAAVSSQSALKAARRWSRSGGGSKTLGALSQDAIPSSQATSRQPTLGKLKMSAKVAGRKEAFQWQRGQTSPTSVISSRASLHRLGAMRRSPLTRKSYKQPQRSKAGKAGPAKLVRVGGVLYRVSGIGKGRSLKRQVTPKPLPRPSLSQV